MCGISREGAKLERALTHIPQIRDRFFSDVKVGGDGQSLNQRLEYGGASPTSSSSAS